MHCGTRRLPEKKQTEELPTLAEFMGIKSEERINRFVKKRGSDFGSDNNSALLHFRTPLGLGLGLRQSFQPRFFMMSHQ